MYKNNKKSRITKSKLEKYFLITKSALKIAKKKVNKKREKEAQEIIEMVTNYLKDAEHFQKKGHYVNAFACINYAHGWLDAGARTGIFNVKDNKLFVIK